MPDTRPGIVFDDEGVCHACRVEERKDLIDWDARWSELEKLCDKHRRTDGYDCIIAVSGGKDSHTQVYVMKELLKMNPLLVTVEDNFPMTEAGKHNIRNISEAFSCDIISLKPNIEVQKRLMRYTFEKYGKPTWYIDRLIYTYPIYMAVKLGIPLIIYGENVNYEYSGGEETYSAKEQINNGVASEIPFNELTENPRELYLCEYQDGDIEPIYLSYFMRWNSVENAGFAMSKGFRTLDGEWERAHCVENFDQIDTRAYLVHPWMKYPKFGHATATDYASRFVRYKMIDREQAMEMVEARDHDLDPQCVKDFCEFLGYTTEQFWSIVDQFYNKDLFDENKKLK